MRFRIPAAGVVAALAVCLGLLPAGRSQDPPAPPPVAGPAQPVALLLQGPGPQPAKAFPRGAKRSPGHRVASSPKFQLGETPPPQFAMVPAGIHKWGNDQYGDCVSAQEACSMAAWTTFCGQPVVPSDAEVVAFARRYGLLNGAVLTQVMDIMSRYGMVVGGKVYKDGGYSSVNYSVPVVLQGALTVGPVNIAIDADALPRGAGNQQGWYATGGRPGQFGNTDHCVTLLGYGPAAYCFQAINCPVPAGLDPARPVYLLDTWGTIGCVDHDWVLSTVEEAWVRSPTTVGFAPPAPAPPPTPNPPVPPAPPVPPVPGAGFTGTMTYVGGVLTAVTPGGQPPAPPPGPGALSAVEAEFKAAGVSPAVIVDVLKLLADLKAKASIATIAADVIKIVADLSGVAEAKQVRAAPKKYPAVVPGPELAALLALAH